LSGARRAGGRILCRHWAVVDDGFVSACVQMAAKYKDEAERWKRRLDECEAVNARLREELVAVHQVVQQMYSTRAAATALSSLSAVQHHPITPPNSLESNETAD